MDKNNELIIVVNGKTYLPVVDPNLDLGKFSVPETTRKDEPKNKTRALRVQENFIPKIRSCLKKAIERMKQEAAKLVDTHKEVSPIVPDTAEVNNSTLAKIGATDLGTGRYSTVNNVSDAEKERPTPIEIIRAQIEKNKLDAQAVEAAKLAVSTEATTKEEPRNMQNQANPIPMFNNEINARRSVMPFNNDTVENPFVINRDTIKPLVEKPANDNAPQGGNIAKPALPATEPSATGGTNLTAVELKMEDLRKAVEGVGELINGIADSKRVVDELTVKNASLERQHAIDEQEKADLREKTSQTDIDKKNENDRILAENTRLNEQHIKDEQEKAALRRKDDSTRKTLEELANEVREKTSGYNALKQALADAERERDLYRGMVENIAKITTQPQIGVVQSAPTENNNNIEQQEPGKTPLTLLPNVPVGTLPTSGLRAA